MSEQSHFTITYWGITGTLCSPLRPSGVTEKFVEAVQVLVEKQLLGGLAPGPGLAGEIRSLVERELPFHLRSTYGGNTTCVEVQTPDTLLILDCGSGFRELGVALEARWRKASGDVNRTAHVLVTHAHMDHTFATPFFAPYFNSKNSITVWGPKAALNSLEAVLDPASALSQLYFPPTYAQMKAINEFRAVEPGADFMLGNTRLRTYGLNHPGGSMAYRIDHSGRSFVFATDHEHKEVPDRGLAEFARGADLLYTEGQYTQREYDGLEGLRSDPPLSRHGWGHTPIEKCVQTAVAAGVRLLHLGHFDPRRTDQDIARLEGYAQRLMAEELERVGLPAGSCRVLAPHEEMQVELLAR